MGETGQRGFAVAVFVKTPGRSPLKTRLAKTIGEDAAHRFYKLSCAAICDTLRTVQAASGGVVIPYWAVAETDSDDAWKEFPVIHQGAGELGDKLDLVYRTLQEKHGGCMLIGADAPHVTPATFLEVMAMHDSGTDFVFGPARDGGFYLFSGRKAVPASIWKTTPYSAADTLGQLMPKIEGLGTVRLIEALTDVDVADDLASALHEMNKGTSAVSGSGPLFDLAAYVRELIAHHS